MSETAPRRWTIEEFFAWQEDQADRYELVGGFPVRMTAGAKNVHDDIVVNLLGELRNQLRGGAGRPFTGDGSIETIPGQIRRPDVGVDCGRRDPHGTRAALPRMVAEVLSPSTRDFDAFDKVEEYKQVDSLEYILMVEPNAPEAIFWFRGTDRSWQKRSVAGPEHQIDMPEIGVTFAMADIYEGVEFPVGAAGAARPRLVPGADEEEPAPRTDDTSP